jgi:hypothetical protein
MEKVETSLKNKILVSPASFGPQSFLLTNNSVSGCGSTGLYNLRVSLAKLPISTLLAHLPLPSPAPRASNIALPALRDELHPTGMDLPATSSCPPASSNLSSASSLDAKEGCKKGLIPTADQSLQPGGGTSQNRVAQHHRDLTSCSSLLGDTANDDDCDTEQSAAAINGKPLEWRHRHSESSGSPPAVKKVKLEDSKSGGNAQLGAVKSCAAAENTALKCDARTKEGDAPGLYNAALPLKREISAEEAKFDIMTAAAATTAAAASVNGDEKKDCDAAGAKSALLLSAAEMKLEIAKIDRILEGRLLLPRGGLPGLKEEEKSAAALCLLKERRSVVIT